MPVGKVSGTILKRSVVNLLKCPPRTAVDAASAECGDIRILSASAVGLTDCVIAPDLAVIKAANNIWVSGGEVLMMEASFILPKSYNEYQLKAYTKRVKAACELCGTSLSGGHTEVTDGVKRFCMTATAVGVGRGDLPSIRNVKTGMDIVVTKWIGLEETAMIVSYPEKVSELRTRFTDEYLEPAMHYAEWLTVRDEADIAMKYGVAAMHDVSDGGIFRALWEFAEGAGKGFDIDLRAIPVRQETIEIAEFFRINPYMMKSSGSVIIACEDGAGLLAAMEEAGIPACVIGKVTDNNAKILRNEDEVRYLDKM